VPAPAPRKNWLLPAVLLAIIALGAGLYFALRPADKVVETPKKEIPAAPPATLSLPSGDMVLVAAGPFLFGENKETVSLPAFYVDKTEVTNEAYGRFCKETGKAPPQGFDESKPSYPVVYVSILEARDFAKWA